MANSVSDTSGYLRAVRVKAVNKQIFRALLSLASAALFVRVAGMINQVVVTSRFGAGPRMDAYFIATTLPTLIALVFGNVIEATIIPAYARVRSQGTKEDASVLFSTLLNLLLVGIAVLTSAMFIFRSQTLLLSAPGSNPGTLGLAISLSPFTFPVLLLMLLVNYMECILNTEGQFAWPAYAGMLVPATSAVLVFALGRSSLSILALCVGMLLGLCLQLGLLTLRARRAGISYRPVIDLRNPALGLIVRAAWPVLFGGIINQAASLIDQIFASYLSQGSISAISYSLKIASVFSGVIFVSVGRAAHPHLSRQVATNDMAAFKETLRFYVWLIAIVTIALSLFLLVFAHALVQLLFQRGAFIPEDTNRTAMTLLGFVVGLPPTALAFIAFRAFSALGRTRIMLYVALFSVIADAVFDGVFAHYWQSFGIALATSAVYACTVCIMYFALRRMIGPLGLFTPPREIHELFARAQNSFTIPYAVRQRLVRLGAITIVFLTGALGAFVNSLNALRIAWASIVMLALLRYNFVLLLGWILINAPNTLPFFRGTHVLVGLTVPTLLSLLSLPIKQTVKRLPALCFLFLYLLWASASLGISPIGLGPAVTAWILELDCLAVTILAINVLNTRRRLLICVDTLLLLSTGIALYGIYGYFTKQNGFVDNATSLYRIVSIFAAAPGLAFFLSLVIPLALYRAATLQGSKRVLAVLSAIILLVATALTFTRAAYVCVPLSIIIMAFYLPSRRMRNVMLRSVIAVALLVVLLSAIGNFPILARFTTQDIATLNGRTYLWQAILAHFDAGRLLGNGILASDALLTVLQEGIPGQGVIGTSPHDLLVGTLYDHGIIGAILLILVFLALFSNVIAGMRKASGEQRALYAVALAVLVGVLVQSFDSNEFWDPSVDIYIWIVIILPFARCWSRQEQRAEPPEEDYDDEPTEPRLRTLPPVGAGEANVT